MGKGNHFYVQVTSDQYLDPAKLELLFPHLHLSQHAKVKMSSGTDSTVQRLKLVKNMIELGETASLDEQAQRLHETAEGDSEALDHIATALSEERYSDAVSQIDDFIGSREGAA